MLFALFAQARYLRTDYDHAVWDYLGPIHSILLSELVSVEDVCGALLSGGNGHLTIHHKVVACAVLCIVCGKNDYAHYELNPEEFVSAQCINRRI